MSGFINRSLRHCHHTYGGLTLQWQVELQRDGACARWAHRLAVGLSDDIIVRWVDPRPLALAELKTLLPAVTIADKDWGSYALLLELLDNAPPELQEWLYGGSGTGSEGVWGRTRVQEKYLTNKKK